MSKASRRFKARQKAWWKDDRKYRTLKTYRAARRDMSRRLKNLNRYIRNEKSLQKQRVINERD